MAITLNDEKLTGLIFASVSNTVPEGFLLCDGSAINRTTYSGLFALSPSTSATVTIAIASPGVVTWNSHGLATGHSIQFSTTGTLPTGVVAGTVYFIRLVDTNSFHLYDTQANAMNTAATTGRVNTSGSQSGTHTALVYFWGNGNGSSTFNIPDGRGGVLRGTGTSTGYTTSATVRLGSKNDDAMQTHTHTYTATTVAGYDTIYDGVSMTSSTNDLVFTTLTSNNNNGRTATETIMKNIGVNFYIKY